MSHVLSPEPNLTLHNLISTLEGLAESRNWWDLAREINLPSSKRKHIEKQFKSKNLCKEESLKEFLMSHPVPSWYLVSDAIYIMGWRMNNPAYHTALERVASMCPTGEYVASQCTHYSSTVLPMYMYLVCVNSTYSSQSGSVHTTSRSVTISPVACSDLMVNTCTCSISLPQPVAHTSSDYYLSYDYYIIFIIITIIAIVFNLRQECSTRVTVVVFYVCQSVCVHAHYLVVRAIKSIMKETIVFIVRLTAILKCHYFYYRLIAKLEHFLLTSAEVAIFVETYSTFDLSYTPRYTFANFAYCNIFVTVLSLDAL